jgi:hypothetical protein
VRLRLRLRRFLRSSETRWDGDGVVMG